MSASEFSDLDDESYGDINNRGDYYNLLPISKFPSSSDSANSDFIQPKLISLDLSADELNESSWDCDSTAGQSSITSGQSNSRCSSKNYSFTNEKVREINRANSHLMQRIIKAKPSQASNLKQTQNAPALVASAAIHRKKKQLEIDRQNEILKNKLKAVMNRKIKG